VRTRPCSVFGRPVHLSGLLPLITTRWFSSSLSDPASRQTPCPPKIRRWRLQVSLSVSRLSPSCLTSLSIPCHHLRPMRHYPHLWISARGLGLSGTSTHLTRQLSGTHYGAVRLLRLVHHRLRLAAFPTRATGRTPVAKPETSRFPHKELPCMRGVSDLPGPSRRSRMARRTVWSSP